MRVAIFAACLAAVSLPSAATAHDIKQKGLQIVHPWAHESGADEAGKGNASSAGVYMTIRNQGRGADRLVSASTPRAARAQLVVGSQAAFAIKPGEELTLNTTAGYLQLVGLTKPLHMHDNFPLTLIFEKAGRIEVEVHIEELRIQSQHKH